MLGVWFHGFLFEYIAWYHAFGTSSRYLFRPMLYEMYIPLSFLAEDGAADTSLHVSECIMGPRAASKQLVGETTKIWMAIKPCLLCFLAFPSFYGCRWTLCYFDWSSYIAKVYMCRFWMQLHGGPTPKPTLVYSCMQEIEALNLGKLTKTEKERRTGAVLVRPFVCIKFSFQTPTFKLAAVLMFHPVWCAYIRGKYHDKKGQQRFTGTRALRSSQWLWDIFIYMMLTGLVLWNCPFSMSTPWSLVLARCYPAGFGHNLRNVWEAHLGALPARRELRFKPQINEYSTPLQQFESLPLNDLWEDAKLYEPLAYLFKSKHLRWDGCFFLMDWFEVA